MDAITRLSATDPVLFSDMNAIFGEIEARDNALAQQTNDLSAKFTGYTNLTLANGWANIAGAELSYAKSGNIVKVNGIIYGGTTTNGTVLATGLPTTYKSYETKLMATSTTKIIAVNIFQNGTLLIGNDSFSVIGATDPVYIDLTYFTN